MIIRTKTKGAVSDQTLSDNKVMQVPIVMIIRAKTMGDVHPTSGGTRLGNELRLPTWMNVPPLTFT